jgi:hypothetical protein
MLLPQHINLSPQQHLSDSCTICCMLTYYKCYPLLKNKALVYHKFADQETLFLEHALHRPSCNDTFLKLIQSNKLSRFKAGEC